jgi:hypothetical protein
VSGKWGEGDREREMTDLLTERGGLNTRRDLYVGRVGEGNKKYKNKKVSFLSDA